MSTDNASTAPVHAVVLHPVQVRATNRPQINSLVTLRAYEVYSHLFGRQESLVTGQCRGGFGAGELAAFLYARSFPQAEWQQRVDEALNGMNL